MRLLFSVCFLRIVREIKVGVLTFLEDFFFFFGNGNDLCALMLLMSWIMTYLSHLFEFEVKKKCLSTWSDINPLKDYFK